MNIFAGLKHFLKLAGISAAGPSTLLRRIAAILSLFYGILTTLLYLVFEAKTFQERAECIMFLNSLSNGSTLYLLSLWRQDIFALLDEMQIKINRREWGKLQHVVFQTWSIFFFNLAWNAENCTISGALKVSNRLYEKTHNNIEIAFKKIVTVMFGALLPMVSAPGMMFSYYKYFVNENGESSFKLTFLSK